MAHTQKTPESKAQEQTKSVAGAHQQQEALQREGERRQRVTDVDYPGLLRHWELHPFRRLQHRRPESLLPRGGLLSSLGVPESLLQSFVQMRDDLDRLLEEGFGPARALSAFAPQIDVFTRDGNLVVRADLPGVRKEDVRVEVEQDTLFLSGERRSEEREEREGYFRSERSYGSFQRAIPLPEGCDTHTVQASFDNGVLEVTLKAPEQKPRGRRVEIQDKGAQPSGPVH